MTNDNHSSFMRIAEQVESRRAELGVPGATFGLMINGESYTGGVGITHAQHPLPVNDETIFQIGSITKTVTATAMMRLVERGPAWISRRRCVRTCLTSGYGMRKSRSVLKSGIC